MRMRVFSLILFSIIVCLVFARNKTRCARLPHGCCPHTRWNEENNECEECQIGYIGMNCNLKCIFPYFGKMCKHECECPKDSCDFAHGCNKDHSTIDTTNEEPKHEKLDTKGKELTKNTNKLTIRGNTITTNNFPQILNDDTKLNESTTENMIMMYTQMPINSSSMFTTKHPLFKIGTSALGIVLIAYITVWVIDKRRKKTLEGCRNQHIQLL
ncbi:uncharacterized protein LOC144625915 [Crassostrea virginica]